MSTDDSHTLTKRFLLFPIRTGAPKKRIVLEVNGQRVREFDAELSAANEANFWAPLDVAAFQGKQATLSIGDEHAGFVRIKESDELPPTPNPYNEPLRPQFHFSQRVGWNNDPNGLVFHAGEWHLFFQHNPYGWNWGNMHWGHAVSRDRVHWEQLPIAIYNHRYDDWAFSGGAVVDEHNTAGWQRGEEKVIVASYTSTGRGECIAYSNDRGRTFAEYEANPVVRHRGRDPKIIWHEQAKHWVMAVYDEPDKDTHQIAFYTSPDLKKWSVASKLPGYFECPEMFELPVDGDPKNTRWVVFAADAKYAVGKFDGMTFTPEHEGKRELHYGNYYASQTVSNAPDGRRIQIGWARIDMPGMPFNQTFSFPHELTLRTTDDGIRMFAEPVKEIEQLHTKQHLVNDKKLTDGKPFDIPMGGELFHVRATFDVGDAREVSLDLGGNRITYDVANATLNGAPLKPKGGQIQLQLLLDRPMMEICGNAGRVFITLPRTKHGNLGQITSFSTGGQARLVSLEINELESIWKNAGTTEAGAK